MECVPKHGWSSSSSAPAATATPSTSVITTFSVILSPLGLVKSGACGFACPMALISLARMLTWRQRMRVGHSSDPLPGTRTLAWSVLATTHPSGPCFCTTSLMLRAANSITILTAYSPHCSGSLAVPFFDKPLLLTRKFFTWHTEPPKTGCRLAAGWVAPRHHLPHQRRLWNASCGVWPGCSPTARIANPFPGMWINAIGKWSRLLIKLLSARDLRRVRSWKYMTASLKIKSKQELGDDWAKDRGKIGWMWKLNFPCWPTRPSLSPDPCPLRCDACLPPRCPIHRRMPWLGKRSRPSPSRAFCRPFMKGSLIETVPKSTQDRSKPWKNSEIEPVSETPNAQKRYPQIWKAPSLTTRLHKHAVGASLKRKLRACTGAEKFSNETSLFTIWKGAFSQFPKADVRPLHVYMFHITGVYAVAHNLIPTTTQATCSTRASFNFHSMPQFAKGSSTCNGLAQIYFYASAVSSSTCLRKSQGDKEKVWKRQRKNNREEK